MYLHFLPSEEVQIAHPPADKRKLISAANNRKALDHIDPRLAGTRILINHHLIGRVTFPPIAAIAPFHHQDVVFILGEVSEGERRLSGQMRARL